ncbi:TrmB family transcriptional regulator sugar-binding domain-containing protein [Streptomyces huasconensis]|uniref:TrmB family transcriptional regulator sugar-binding domain-containing protein n=1 Tax=Streptomyces huasconensis TaxID=1854574 RepID=UPI0033E05F1A
MPTIDSTVPVDAIRTGAPMAAPSNDEVERILLQARSLVETAVSKHRSDVDQRSVSSLDGTDAALSAAAEPLVDAARSCVLVVLPEDCDPEVFGPLLVHLGKVAARGVAVRVLATARLLESGELLRDLDKFARRVEVRLVEAPLQEMVLVDDTAALVRTRGDATERQALVVRAPVLLRHLRMFFAASWPRSVALADYRKLSDRSRNGLARRILVALSSGRTDEAAARELGMSVRTYRRNVADIARELGANSRFQAGVRAVELGLLSPMTRSRELSESRVG